MAEEVNQQDLNEGYESDPIATSARLIPWLVPLCGAIMMFCLALVAVFFGAPGPN